MNEVTLRYGMNPQQKEARVYAAFGDLPFEVLCGAPGFINLLDALNAWQLVRELKKSLGLVAATSFKHVSPAGAAVGLPLDEPMKKALMVEELELSEMACAYARARGADRLSSFGDFIALSDSCDLPTAQIIAKEVSDGIIAPGYDEDALKVLEGKKDGKYLVIEIDPAFEPGGTETRELFGVLLEQQRNTVVPGLEVFDEVVTQNKEIPEENRRDLALANISIKFTQSNTIGLSWGGQMIGIGAGQQSRIHCTRLACGKAERWYLRQHPKMLDLPFKSDVLRALKVNAIDQLLEEDEGTVLQAVRSDVFERKPEPLSQKDKQEWIETMKGVSLASDAFFPFRDSIDRAKRTGVEYVVQPGGSTRDQGVIEACDEHGMAMLFTGVRLFHH